MVDLNPVHAISDAANGAKNVGDGAVSAAHNLAGDAYDTASTAFKSGRKVASDVTHLEFDDAFKDAAKGGVQVGKHVVRLADDQTKMVIASAKVFNPLAGEALDLGNVALKSAQNMAILDPAAGMANLGGKGVNALTGAHLPSLELHQDTGAEKHGIAGKAAEYAGGIIGAVAPFVATGGMMAAAETAGTAARASEAGRLVGKERFLLSAGRGTEAAAEAAPRVLSKAEVDALWTQQAKSDGVFHFRKGYYEANLQKVDAQKYPDGITLSTSENPIRIDTDSHLFQYAGNVDDIALPNGTQMYHGKIIAPAEGVKIGDITVGPNGPVLRTYGGAKAEPNDYIIQRASTDEAGLPRIDTYAQNEATMQKKWQPVDNKPGFYSPKTAGAEPAEMVRIPEGMKVKFKASYGEDVTNSGPAWLVKDGDGHYIITERDLRETYVGATDESAGRMQKILDDASRIAGSPVPRAQAK